MPHDLTVHFGSEANNWMNDVIFLIPNWKWIGLGVGILLGLIALSLARPILLWFKTRYEKHEKLPHAVCFFLQKDIHHPVAWLLAAGIWHVTLHSLNLHEGFTTVMGLILHLLILFNLFRLAYMGVESVGQVLEEVVHRTTSSMDGQLAPFMTKILKVVVIILGILLSLQSLGFNVGAMLAGLGIGSLALALAAQDTAANLFGSITIIFDQPFVRGDYIKIGDTEGTVEQIGFRTTRIRTPYLSLIAIPNATVAKEKIDNLGVRPARRLIHTLRVGYATHPDRIEALIQELKHLLAQHPMVEKKTITVALQGYGEYAHKVGIEVFLNITNGDDEGRIQQELLLAILRLCLQLKVELALPAQTLNIASLPAN